MLNVKFAIILGALVSFLSAQASAFDTITDEPDGNSYNFVSNYEVVVEARAEAVWSVLSDLGAWMYEFEMAPVSGEPGKEGQVLKLYAEQDFMVQITKTIANRLLVVSNLPVTFRGEHSTGVAIITLEENDGKTRVRMIMSRRYTWQGEGDNPMKDARGTQEFQNRTHAMWQDRFMGRLKALAEG